MHLLVALLAKWITHLIQRSIRERAKVTAAGISGRIGLAIAVLPLIAGSFFFLFGRLAIADPDRGDRIVGHVVVALGEMLFICSLHFFTFRITATENEIVAGSLVTGKRRIDLGRSFRLQVDPNGESVSVFQDRVRIRVSWTMHGHSDFIDWLSQAKRRHYLAED